MSAALPMVGHGEAQASFLAALGSGRLHHGWLVQGPSGIGKALFVRRLAALMLGAAGPDAPDSDPVMQKVLSGSHPDLRWLQREPGDKGVMRQDIIVDQIRALNHFFTLKPALAGWRVGVIDALDETNRSSMNALLKTLEEPPQKAIMFLISHGARPVLPTVRSRCRVLRLQALSDGQTREAIELAGGEVGKLTRLARGRPGYALGLGATGGARAAELAINLLREIERPAPALIAETLQAAASDAGALSAYCDVLLDWTARRAEDVPDLARTWLALHEVRASASAMNMTPLQTATKLLAVLQGAVKTPIIT